MRSLLWSFAEVLAETTKTCSYGNIYVSGGVYNTSNCSMILNTDIYWSVKFRIDRVTNSDNEYCVFPLSVIYFKFYMFFFWIYGRNMGLNYSSYSEFLLVVINVILVTVTYVGLLLYCNLLLVSCTFF